ncbi:MAG TPA: ANTAR domain-containing protein, partial [Variovorax sp.]|nr:ANTAR domain-containing protein [Variovorax sp.]
MPTPTTHLHLVFVDPSAGLADAPEPLLAVRRALDAAGAGRSTVHAGVEAFLGALPGLAGAGPVGAADLRVLLCAPPGVDGVLDVLRRVVVADEAAGGMPWPVAVLGPPLDAAAHEALVDAGVHAWADVGTVDAPVLRALADRARARWRRERALRSELVQLRTRMDERKWVDKAKGLLMLARGMGEDEAFALLRSTAMHANLRLGEVSRAVIDAARWAGSVNRAGQLRML